jgi:hypothetical protein
MSTKVMLELEQDVLDRVNDESQVSGRSFDER